MPSISRFFGINIQMHWDDHNPPHFHAIYGDNKAVIDINTCGIIEGYLPPKIFSFVAERAWMNKENLLDDWERGCKKEPFIQIPPLA